MSMKKLIALSALVATVASAQVVAPDAARLTWTNAAGMETGEPFPATGPLSIIQTRVQRSVTATCATGAFGTVAEVVNVPVTSQSALFEKLRPAGLHCFRVAHVQENGAVGAWSQVVSKTIVVSTKAGPPTLTIQ